MTPNMPQTTQPRKLGTVLECAVCGACAGNSSCTPLLVGGEVIGSVLVNRDGAIDEDAHLHIRESVRQAAPVIANWPSVSAPLVNSTWFASLIPVLTGTARGFPFSSGT